MPDKVISKSCKRRFPANYHPKEGKQIYKDMGPRDFKQVVTTFKVGKNQKGKKIFASYTSHVLA